MVDREFLCSLTACTALSQQGAVKCWRSARDEGSGDGIHRSQSKEGSQVASVFKRGERGGTVCFSVSGEVRFRVVVPRSGKTDCRASLTLLNHNGVGRITPSLQSSHIPLERSFH
jgi:hypothetical protein